MNRRALIRELAAQGCVLLRHGSRHDLGRQAPIPRHGEIKESLVRLIRKQLGLVG